jgi:hypothetical protein
MLPQAHNTHPFQPLNTRDTHRDTQEQEHIRWEEQRKTMSEEAQRQAQLAQYNDELARKRQQAEHELQRQRNGEMVSLQEQAAARKEAERLRIEQQIQAERRAADQYAVRSLRGCFGEGSCCDNSNSTLSMCRWLTNPVTVVWLWQLPTGNTALQRNTSYEVLVWS